LFLVGYADPTDERGILMTTASERMGVRRFENENAEEALREEYPLVEKNLAPEAERARRALELALIQPMGRRASAAFLETDDYAKVQETVGDVIGCLLMECLPHLVRQLRGQIVTAGMIVSDGDGGTVLNPIQHTVEVAGRTHYIVDCGYLFIHLPEERVVVSSACKDSYHEGLVYELTVRSNRDSAAFFRRWKDFAREHNYLRGRTFFADGKIIERKRTYSWDDIILPLPVRQTIETHVEGFLRSRGRLKRLGVKARRGLILEGPPGTGKTLLGKVLADTLGCSFMWVLPRHVSGPAVFAHILEVARFVAPTVLFFEDIDLFAEDRDARGGMALGELMNQLDGAVDNEDIITMAATNRLEVVEKALQNRPGRFDRVLHIGTMDKGDRRRLLVRLLAKAEVAEDALAILTEGTDGYTGAQVEELVSTIYILAAAKGGGTADDGGDNGDGQRVVVDRALAQAALKELQAELKARVGFHAG